MHLDGFGCAEVQHQYWGGGRRSAAAAPPYRYGGEKFLARSSAFQLEIGGFPHGFEADASLMQDAGGLIQDARCGIQDGRGPDFRE